MSRLFIGSLRQTSTGTGPTAQAMNLQLRVVPETGKTEGKLLLVCLSIEQKAQKFILGRH
jgi:hypothetical protein